MRNQNALSRPQRLANARGAAFLLAVYFASLMLFLLGGVSLQRTMTEVRAAQTSRDSLQAFYLAEGALDRAVIDLQAQITAVADNTTRPVTMPVGYATYTVVTTSPNNAHPITRRITVRACIAPTRTTTNCLSDSRSAQQQIRADISEPPAGPPLQGLIGGERLYLFGPATALLPSQYMQVSGDVHAGGGNTCGLEVNRTKITGAVSMGTARADSVDWMWPAYSTLYGAGIDLSFYPSSFSGPPTLSSGPGIQMYPGTSQTDHFSSTPTVKPALTPDISDPTYGVRTQDPIDQALQQNHAACTSSIALSGAAQRTIADGDPLDITGPGDGKIAVCVTGVSLSDTSRLTFTSPATVYVTGASYSQTGHATLQAVSGGAALPNGVEIVLPRWAQSLPTVWGYAGRFALEDWYPPIITLGGGTFHGSIWAPYAEVRIQSNRDAGDVLEPVNLFSYITRIYGASTHEVFRFGSSSPSSASGGASAKPSLISWSN